MPVSTLRTPADAGVAPEPTTDVVRQPGVPTAPDLIGNRNYWSVYPWPQRGDEWSDKWGSTEMLWRCSLSPRLAPYLPSGHILEIAPGFGRVTQYLRTQCRRMTLVDLTERCIDACRQRFATDSHIRYVVNDGRSLEMIEPGSIDLIVSWDSLVHCDRDTLRAYIEQFPRIMKPGAVGFIHHSNLGHHEHDLRGDEPVEITGARRVTCTAERFVEDCARVGVRVLSQEIVPWNDCGLWSDCFSLFTFDPPNAQRPPKVVFRHDWPVETALARRIGAFYPPVMRQG